jgi:YVTN family beta-propeller protein
MKSNKLFWLAAAAVLFFPQKLLAETIYTANEGGSSLSVISWPGDGKSVTVPLSAMPHNVDIAGKRQSVLVTGMEGVLLVLDARGNLLKTIEAGEHPAHVIADQEGDKAYVTLSGADAVAVVDLETGKMEKKIPVGKFPHGLRMNPDGKEIYVANMEGGTVSIVSVAEKKETIQVAAGKKPVQVAVTPDGKTVYISLNAENAVAVLDVASRTVLKKITVGEKPVQLFVAGNKLFVANQGGRDNPGKTVTVIDLLKNEPLADISVGKGPHGVALSPDGKTVFVTNVYDSTVSVIDAEKMAVVKTIPVGEGPNGIAVSGQ